MAGLEPVTSAVTGQRSNQLSYTPAIGACERKKPRRARQDEAHKKIRAADAKEVGVGNPAEETYCYPNDQSVKFFSFLSTGYDPNSVRFSIPRRAHTTSDNAF